MGPSQIMLMSFSWTRSFDSRILGSLTQNRREHTPDTDVWGAGASWVSHTRLWLPQKLFHWTQGEAADFPCENRIEFQVKMKKTMQFSSILINLNFRNSTCCAKIWRDVLDVIRQPLFTPLSQELYILNCLEVTCWFSRQRASNLARPIAR